MITGAMKRVLLSVLLLLCVLDLFELSHQVVTSLIFEVLVMVPLKLLIVFIFNVFHDELGGTESFIANSARVFFALCDLLCLVKAVLSRHFHEESILLRILNLLLRPTLQKLLSLLNVILLELPG